MSGKELNAKVRETVEAIETERVLLGLLPQEQAIERLQTADNLRNPVDHEEVGTDEFQQAQLEKREEYVQIWEDAKSSVEPPVPFRSNNIQLRDLPEKLEVADHLEAFIEKDSFQEVVGDLPEDSWEFKEVPIPNLVAFQPNVTRTAYQEIPTRDEGIDSILEYCFPVDATGLLMRQPIRSADDNFLGMQFVSRNPNLQLRGMEVGQREDSRGTFVTFQIQSQPNFVQVAHFKDRYILKNGYHRVFQLMQEGETHVPAVVRDVSNYDDTGGRKEGFFSEDLVMGPRPPLMKDYQSDVAVDLDKPGTNKVIRMIAESTSVLR